MWTSWSSNENKINRYTVFIAQVENQQTDQPARDNSVRYNIRRIARGRAPLCQINYQTKDQPIKGTNTLWPTTIEQMCLMRTR